MKHIHRGHSFVTTGITSLFLIFAVLCMAILSLLSLGNSRSDRSLSQKSLDNTLAYYEAVSQAADFQSDLEVFLEKCYNETNSKESYERLVEKDLPEEFPDCIYQKDSQFVTRCFPFSEKQELKLVLSIAYPLQEGDPYVTAAEFRTQASGEWTPDSTQPVLRKEKNHG